MTRIKISPIILSSLLLISTFSSLLLNVSIAKAAGGILTYSDMSADQEYTAYKRTLSYEFYKALTGCISNNKSDYEAKHFNTSSIPAIKSTSSPSDLLTAINPSNTTTKTSIPEDIDISYYETRLSGIAGQISAKTENIDLFSQIFTYANDDVTVGHIAEDYVSKQGLSVGKDNGIVSCINLSKAAYKFWNLDSVGAPSILSAIGYKSTAYDPGTGTSYIFYSIDKQPTLGDYLRNNIYAGNDVVLTDDLKYYIYKYFLFNANQCKAEVYDPSDTSALIESSGTFAGTSTYESAKATMFIPGEDNTTGESKVYDLKFLNRIQYPGYNTDPEIAVNYNSSFGCADIAKNISAVTANIIKNRTYSIFFNVIKNTDDMTSSSSQDKTQDKTQDNKTSCAISGIGWIVCPVVNFLAGIADGAFGFLSNNFLKVNTKIFDTESDQYNNTYKAWTMMRNVANILFVIAFLIIIYSQMTGFGMTNYGVKKLLPRLVVAAVLVNISFFICQIAVDISNILGFSLKNFFGSLINTGSTVKADWTQNGNTFTGIAGGILAASGAWFALSAFIPILISVVVALIMILFILVGRQVAIILLIVVSPVAFVAYLLPNTDQWFKKWKKMFTSMLILFPLIALVFGMSNLASAIIGTTLGAGVTSGDNTATSVGSETIGQIMSAAVLILPLFVVPTMLKKSLDSLGSIGTKINGIGTKASTATNKQFQNSNAGQYLKYRQSQRDLDKVKSQTGIYEGRNPYRRAMSAVNGGINKMLKTNIPGTNTGILGKNLKNYAMNAESRGKSMLDKEFEDEVSMATASQKQLDSSTLMSIANGTTKSTEAVRTAAIRNMLKIGNYDERKEVYSSIGVNGTTSRQKKAMEEGFFAKGDNQFFGAKFAAEFSKEDANINNDILNNAIFNNAKNITAKSLVDNASATSDIFDAIKNKPIDQNIQNIIDKSREVSRPDSPLASEISAEKKKYIDQISGLGSNNPV